jgi:hypothetical protein
MRYVKFCGVIVLALALFTVWVVIEVGAHALHLPGTRFGGEPLWYPPDW